MTNRKLIWTKQSISLEFIPRLTFNSWIRCRYWCCTSVSVVRAAILYAVFIAELVAIAECVVYWHSALIISSWTALLSGPRLTVRAWKPPSVKTVRYCDTDKN